MGGILQTDGTREKGGYSPAAQAAGPLIRVLIIRVDMREQYPSCAAQPRF